PSTRYVLGPCSPQPARPARRQSQAQVPGKRGAALARVIGVIARNLVQVSVDLAAVTRGQSLKHGHGNAVAQEANTTVRKCEARSARRVPAREEDVVEKAGLGIRLVVDRTGVRVNRPTDVPAIDHAKVVYHAIAGSVVVRAAQPGPRLIDFFA